MVVDPTATLVTRPRADTVATPVTLLDQVITRPVNAVPLTSFGVAVNCTARPTEMLVVAGVTVTDATGAGVGFTAVVPLATLESPPNTATPFKTPRNATSRDWKTVDDTQPN